MRRDEHNADGLVEFSADLLTIWPKTGNGNNVALIDVDEGFRMMSRVEDIAPTQVRIGMRVKFRTHKAEGDEPPYPVFTPAEGA